MKRFLKCAAVFLTPVALVCLVFFAAVWRSGELCDYEAAAHASASGDVTLLGLAYRDSTAAFKSAAANDVKAELLVLGTSRSMQLRGEFFSTDSFYNAGGGVAFLSQVPSFLESLDESARPERLILVLDQYFFNKDWLTTGGSPVIDYSSFARPDAGYLLHKFFDAYSYGKFRVLDVLQTPAGVVGLSASARGAGFYPDGSYTYGTDALGDGLDPGFADSIHRILTASSRFEHSKEVAERGVADLRAALDTCRDMGIEVTAFLPPYAPSVWQYMQDYGEHTYMTLIYDEIRPIFDEYGCEVFDYSYLPETSDDQYLDGFHGSDRVYAAICARLARESENLADVLDEARLTALFEQPGLPKVIDFTA